MPSATKSTSSSTTITPGVTRTSRLKRLGSSAKPKPVIRLHLKTKQRTPLCSTPSLKAEFVHNLFGSHAPKKLGEGGFSKVYCMYEKHSGKPYAVKVVQKEDHEDEDDYADRVYDEFEIASRLHHPNVVKTFRLRARSCRWCVVMEHCPNGDVHDLIAHEQRLMVTVDEKLCIFKQLLHGVEYLHSQGVAHRDIKVENMLLNDVGHLKIADFGLSSTGDSSHGASALSRCKGLCGTPVVTPPEVIAMDDDEQIYDGRAYDAWSCAVTMLTMLSPYVETWEFAHPNDKLYAHFLKQWAPYMPDGFDTLPAWVADTQVRNFGPKFAAIRDARLRRLLLRMMHPNPGRRLTISQALDDPFVRQVKCCCQVPNSRDKAPPAQHYHGPPQPTRLKLNLPWKG